MTTRVLVTGAAGFFGSHLLEHTLITRPEWEVVALTRVGKVGHLRRLMSAQGIVDNWDRLHVVWHDFRSPLHEQLRKEIGRVDYILHVGGETHVDRSIESPEDFVQSNIVGTLNMLQYARGIHEQGWLRAFNFFSTDEVYGPALGGVKHAEDFPYNATNPYSATKAGAEQLVNAFGNTYGLPVFTTNTMNLFGEKQHREKYIPKVIRAVLFGEEVAIHADSTRTSPGSRFYIHCRNAADALLWLLERVKPRDRINIVGEVEVNNLALAERIATIVDRPLNYRLVDFHSSRPGHDLRYALDGAKLASMGYTFPRTFDQSLEKTVRWTLEHPEWLL